MNFSKKTVFRTVDKWLPLLIAVMIIVGFVWLGAKV